MTEIKNFLYCLNVNTADGRTDIMGLLNTMQPEYIPGLFSFSISFTILGVKEGEHSITIRFKNPEQEVIASLDNVSMMYKRDTDSNLPEEYEGVNIAAGLQNVDLKKRGVYSTQVLLDGTDMGEFEIFVKEKNIQ